MPLSLLRHIVHNHPFKFGVVFSSAKTSFSDWLVQTQLEKREHIDWRRNGTFALFGAVYLGGVQYAIYVPLFSRLFPGAARYAALPVADKLKDAVGTRSMLAQVVLDQFVHHPLMYFPAFYMLKEVVNGNGPTTGLQKYSNNYKEDLTALWKIWVPSTIVNFAFMPMALRIPWVASTSLIWTCIISAMRGSSDVETDTELAMDAAGGAQFKPLRALYDLGVSAKPDYLYDETKAHLLLTASGRDRVGFISSVTEIVTRGHQGNILDLKAYKVGREFVTIMLVEADHAHVGSLVATLKGMEGQLGQGHGQQQPITVSVQHTQPWLSVDDTPRCKDGVRFTGHFRATGRDSPGVLLRLTKLLSEWELDITSISCNQHLQKSLAPDAATGEHPVQQLFQMSGVVRSFVPVDRQRLDAALVAFEEANGVRIGITETEGDESYSAFRSTAMPRTSAASAAKAVGRLARTITGQ